MNISAEQREQNASVWYHDEIGAFIVKLTRHEIESAA